MLNAKRESKHVEFKETFDPSLASDWCELIKDVVAVANSGGGHILFGVDNHGKATKGDLSAIASLDPAHVVDKIAKYVNAQLGEIEIAETRRGGAMIIVWKIPESPVPLIFENPGTYEFVEKGGRKQQRTSFGRGTLYFRHGAKSEPAKQRDLLEFFERRLEKLRSDWAKGLRKVVEAPEGYNVHVLPPDVRISDEPKATAVRLTNDPEAPGFFKLDPNKTHPHRQKELVREINARLPKGVTINQYDVFTVRRIYGIDANETYTYHPTFGSPQYSPALVTWMVRQFEADPQFFVSAREKFFSVSRSGG